jgi:hypothetical protein
MSRICYFCPDFALPSGGTKCLYRHVFQLNRLGCDAFIVHFKRGFKIVWHGYDVPVLWLDDWVRFSPQDVCVFPEGMTQMMKQSKSFNVHRVVIPLSWSYIYESLPPGEDWNDYGIVNVITPSRTTKEFVEWSMNIPTVLIKDYVDCGRFAYRPDRKIRKISYMSRKSGDFLSGILKRKVGPLADYQWSRLLDLTEDQYAAELISSKVYLATGSREGANISVLEAMSAGCVVVGFSGIGGKDYMVAGGAEQNCVLVENDDLLALGRAVERVIEDLERDASHFDPLITNAIATASRHRSLDEEGNCLKAYFQSLLGRTSSGLAPTQPLERFDPSGGP